jgi:hypothetical protein
VNCDCCAHRIAREPHAQVIQSLFGVSLDDNYGTSEKRAFTEEYC